MIHSSIRSVHPSFILLSILFSEDSVMEVVNVYRNDQWPSCSTLSGCFISSFTCTRPGEQRTHTCTHAQTSAHIGFRDLRDIYAHGPFPLKVLLRVSLVVRLLVRVCRCLFIGAVVYVNANVLSSERTNVVREDHLRSCVRVKSAVQRPNTDTAHV